MGTIAYARQLQLMHAWHLAFTVLRSFKINSEARSRGIVCEQVLRSLHSGYSAVAIDLQLDRTQCKRCAWQYKVSINMSEHKENIGSTTWSKVALAAVMSKVALVSLLAYCHHCLTQHRLFYPRCQILMVQMIAVTNAQQSSLGISHTA